MLRELIDNSKPRFSILPRLVVIELNPVKLGKDWFIIISVVGIT